VSSAIGLCCSTTWTIFGFYINDWNVVIPNVLGIVFSIIQIFVWIYFYRQHKVNPQLDTLVDEAYRNEEAPQKY
jgi:hypothetical protein